MILEFELRVGSAADDATCGLVRSAASKASVVYARLEKAQSFLADDGPQELENMNRFVACRDDKVVGFIDYNAADGYVKMLFVEPALQGQGLATELLRLAAQGAKVPLHLRTQAVNDGALAFYLGQGFQIIDGEVENNWHGDSVVWITLSRRPGE